MSSEEEDMQNRGVPTDKHPWQYVDNNTAIANNNGPGAIYNSAGGILNFFDKANFIGNSGRFPGALYSAAPSSTTPASQINFFHDVVFSGNTAQNGNGGAIYFQGGSLNFYKDVTFENNTSLRDTSTIVTYGGAIATLKALANYKQPIVNIFGNASFINNSIVTNQTFTG